MRFTPFHEVCPETARTETRILFVRERIGDVPPGDYGLLETYCDEPGCDCRRVIFSVVRRESRGPVAVIAYGWESLDFYRRWMKAPEIAGLVEARDLQGPMLNPLSPQSPYAEDLLDLVEFKILSDRSYVERLQRHYALFRERAVGREPVHAAAPRRREKRGRNRAKKDRARERRRRPK